MQKGKWLSEEALQIAEKRKDAKEKGEKERYTHLNAEFQRTARRDQKAFLSDQCKEIEENNRMGKTRGLFKKMRDGNKEDLQNCYKKGTLNLIDLIECLKNYGQRFVALYSDRKTSPRKRNTKRQMVV